MRKNALKIGLRRSLCILMLLIALMCFLSVQAVAASLTREESIAKIEEHILQTFGHHRDEYDFSTLEFMDGIWGFSVVLKEHPETQDGLIVGNMDRNGRLMLLEGPSEIDLHRQIMKSLKSSFESIEAMYAFKQTWEQKLQALIDAGRGDEIEAMSTSHYLRMIYLNIGLPSADDISVEVAKNRAREALAALPGWSKDVVDLYDMIIEIYHTPNDLGKPVYQFLFETRTSLGLDVSERAYEEYKNELLSIFGAVNAIPVYINVKIDAMTGDLVAPPEIECPPVESHFLDFFLR